MRTDAILFIFRNIISDMKEGKRGKFYGKYNVQCKRNSETIEKR